MYRVRLLIVPRRVTLIQFSWDADHVPSIKFGCGFPCLYNDFASLLDDFGLVQMVTEPTRYEKILDLFRTSNHTLVQKIEIVPGIADQGRVRTGEKVKHFIQIKIRSAYDNYLQDLLGLAAQNADENNSVLFQKSYTL